MTKPNKHGLRRLGSSKKDEAIKRQIRKESGFGCVICGLVPYDYEHVDPEFSNASINDPEKMTLLCGGCHTKVTRGWMPKSEVWQAKRNPKCLEAGYNSNLVFTSDILPDITIGSTTFRKCPKPIIVAGEPIITFEKPKGDKKVVSITGNFYNASGVKIASIVKNEWRGLTSNADINVRTIDKCPTITILDSGIEIFEIILDASHNSITVSKMLMEYKGNRIFIKETDVGEKHIVIIGRDINNNGVFLEWGPGEVSGIETISLDGAYTVNEQNPGSFKCIPNN